MDIVIGSDHGGFQLKEDIKKFLQTEDYNVVDFGTYSEDACDYPDYALLVGEAVARGEFKKGILIDGTGGGVCLAANKIYGIRAVTAYNSLTGAYASEHDDCNILCLGGKMIGTLAARDIVIKWIKTPFGGMSASSGGRSTAGGRHLRRLDKIKEIEKKYFK